MSEANNFLRSRVIFVGFRMNVLYVATFWSLEFWCGFQIFGNLLLPVIYFLEQGENQEFGSRMRLGTVKHFMLRNY
jgi:hypothetical protein